MDEVVKLVMEKTGLSEAHAQLAVETVLGFLKTQLPEPLAGQLQALLGAGGAGGAASTNPLGQAGDLVKGLGSLFK